MIAVGIFICFLMVVGIVLLSAHSPLIKRTREDFLKDLESILGAKAEPMEGAGDCFRIRFNFEGLEYLYEDIEQESFREKINKAFLRLKTPSNFTLNFSEKESGPVTRNSLFLISEVPDDVISETEFVNLPKGLKEFRVMTNNTFIANKFLEDKDVLRILLEFKNVDYRGYPFISLKILEGMIVLEFHALGYVNPSLEALQSNIHSIEAHLDRLSYLYKKIDYIVKRA